MEKIEPEARRVTNAKLDRFRLIRHETLHQCLALFRDFLQLRRKDERVPCGLHQFVGHISPLVVVRPVPGALASSERLSPCDQARLKNDTMSIPQSGRPYCGAARTVRGETSSLRCRRRTFRGRAPVARVLVISRGKLETLPAPAKIVLSDNHNDSDARGGISCG